jgi:hypothetical protein
LPFEPFGVGRTELPSAFGFSGEVFFDLLPRQSHGAIGLSSTQSPVFESRALISASAYVRRSAALCSPAYFL